MKIEKINGGFVISEKVFIINGEIEIISNSQCHVKTNQGTILLDLSCYINNVIFTDINLFVEELK